jgi:hypothetical protein
MGLSLQDNASQKKCHYSLSTGSFQPFSEFQDFGFRDIILVRSEFSSFSLSLV